MNATMIKAMMGLYGIAMMMSDQVSERYSREPTKEEWEEYERRIKNKQRELLKKQGMKEFFYPEVTIIALNQKNADRKYKNFLELTKTK